MGVRGTRVWGVWSGGHPSARVLERGGAPRCSITRGVGAEAQGGRARPGQRGMAEGRSRGRILSNHDLGLDVAVRSGGDGGRVGDGRDSEELGSPSVLLELSSFLRVPWRVSVSVCW